METTLSECIGNQIKTARINKRLTQSELATLVGTYQPSIAKVESGKALPTLSFLKKIADSLEVDLEIQMRV